MPSSFVAAEKIELTPGYNISCTTSYTCCKCDAQFLYDTSEQKTVSRPFCSHACHCPVKFYGTWCSCLSIAEQQKEFLDNLNRSRLLQDCREESERTSERIRNAVREKEARDAVEQLSPSY